jgi:hypothetical protein
MASLFGQVYTRQDLLKRVGLMDQIAGVQLSELIDGIGRGVRVAHVRTGGGLSFQVLIDRGLDIYNAEYNGIPLAWVSSTGPTHPFLFEPPDLGWRRTFYGGLMLTCGMTTIGAPSVDQGEALGLHGRVSNLPASNVSYGGYWEGERYFVFIEGQVRETMVFGENLLLHRRIEAELGGNTLSVSDTVTNEGFLPTPHMLLYHVNAGFPVVDDGARLISPSRNVTPRDADAAGGASAYNRFSAPEPSYREQVFFHEMAAGADGSVTAALANPDFNAGQGFGFYVRYRQNELPCFNEWKMMGESVYAVGMEPATNWVSGRAKERKRGALRILQPGEQCHYHITFGLLTSTGQIAQIEDAVRQALSASSGAESSL